MNHYVLRKVNGEVRKHFATDIMSSDGSMGLFYIDTSDGPELIAAIKLGVGNVIENEGAEAPAFDRVKINSSVEGGSEYVEVEDLVSRYNSIRESLKWYQSHYHKKVEEYQVLLDQLKVQARVIKNLSDISKQYEQNGLIKDTNMFNSVPGAQTPPQTQVTHGYASNKDAQAEQQGALQGAQSRFDTLGRECEDFFLDERS